MRVWIIEDDLSFRETLSDVFERTPGLVVGQSFGAVEDALAWIDDAEARNEAWERPDVFLLDINLPGMTGGGHWRPQDSTARDPHRHADDSHRKLHVHSGTEAVAKAVRERLVDDEASLGD